MQITLNEATAAARRIPFLAVRASANSLQLVDLNDVGAGDTFTLTYDGQTTAATAFDSFTASDGSALITTRLEALSNIAAGEVQVFRIGSTQTYAVGFGGTFVGTSVVLLTATPTGFTMGTITGGVSDSALVGLGASWPAADLRITKAGVAAAQGTGTVAEDEEGVYHYLTAAGEVDTLGALVGKVRTFGASVYPFSAQIVSAASGQRILHAGTAQAATSSTVTLAAGASSISDFYAGMLLTITAGTGALQRALIVSSYNGTTKVATVAGAWAVTPSTDSQYEVTPIGSVPIDDIADAVRAEILADGVPFDGADIDAAVSTRATPAQVDTALATYDGPTNAEMVARTLPTAEYATAVALATIDTEIGVIDGLVDALTTAVAALPDAGESATALLDASDGVETNLTPRNALRLLVALACKVSGAGTGTETFRNFNDDTNRIVATVDVDGNRTSITFDLS